MLAIRAAYAFDGEAFIAGGATVFVDGVGIVGVEPAECDVPSGWQLVDHGAATVLPGLIDTHVHLVADGGMMALDRVAGHAEDEIDAVVTGALQRHLAAGVTTVRDLGDRNFAVVQRRDEQRKVDDGLPWIVASGPPITIPGGHCGYMGGEVSGAGQIAAAIHDRVQRAVDVVKVMASGGVNTVGTDIYAPQFTIEDLRLVVDQAHRQGLPVTAHAHAASAMDQAVEVGVEGIEHASYLVRQPDRAVRSGLAGLTDSQATDRQLSDLADSGIAVCPTLGGFTAANLGRVPHINRLTAEAGITVEEIVESRMSLLRRMAAFGVRFVCGADAGIQPHKDHGKYADAVIDLAQVIGSTPALTAASSGAAAAIGLGRSKGRLRPGYEADLLVVRGDLSTGLAALHDVRQVVLRGHPVPR